MRPGQGTIISPNFTASEKANVLTFLRSSYWAGTAVFVVRCICSWSLVQNTAAVEGKGISLCLVEQDQPGGVQVGLLMVGRYLPPPQSRCSYVCNFGAGTNALMAQRRTQTQCNQGRSFLCNFGAVFSAIYPPAKGR